MTNRQLAWDHSSIGSPVTIHPIFVKPLAVLLKEQTIGVGCRYLSSSNREHGMFCATVGVDKNGEGLVISVDKFNEHVDAQKDNLFLPGDIPVPCVFHQRAVCLEERTTNDLACCLKSLHRNASSDQQVSLSRSACLRLHLHLVGPNCKVHLEGMIPAVTFRAVPVPPLPLLPTALSQSMAYSAAERTKNIAPHSKTGFLSMDQYQKAMLLLENDPRINSCPLIGIWVSGVETVAHPFVWASCLRFVSCPSYSQRAVRPEEPFLLMLYSTLYSGPEFYDCLVSGASSKIRYTLLEGLAQLVVTKVPSFSSRMSFAELTPVGDPKKLLIFEEACSILHRDTPPVPHGMHKISLPASDFPTSNPVPSLMAFTLKPCVPDLSLLSECSRFIEIPKQPTQPLYRLDNQRRSYEDHPVLVTFAQKSSGENSNTSFDSCQSSTEPIPRQAFSSRLRTSVYNNLQFEVQKLLESRKSDVDDTKTLEVSDNVLESRQRRNCDTKGVRVGNRIPDSFISNGGCNSSALVRKISETDKVNSKNVATHQDDVINYQALRSVEVRDKQNSEAFLNFQSMFVQKEQQLRELQEQVKTLLECQRDRLQARVPPVREVVDVDLVRKLDKQNEQLEELKTQIDVLLKNQLSSNVHPQTFLEYAPKCSVGVMTSFWGYSNNLLPEAIHGRSPFEGEKNLVRGERLNWESHCLDQDNMERLVDPLTRTTLHSKLDMSKAASSFSAVTSHPGCNLDFHEHHANQEPLTCNSNTEKQTGDAKKCNRIEKGQKGASVVTERSNQPGKQSCVCSSSNCSMTMEEERCPFLSEENLTLGLMSLKLSQLSFSALSVDASLPLGASVSMIGPPQTKMNSGRRQGECNSEESSFEVPTTTFYRDLQMQVDQLIQNQPIRRKGASRFSLPGKNPHGKRRDQRRSLEDINIHAWSNQQQPPQQKWDCSILLPRLNYQTLCLSDESDNDWGEEAEKLSRKYSDVLLQEQRLGIIPQGRALTSKKASGQLAAEIRKTSNFSIDTSKNMSFATKAYLERHGLASKF